MDKLYSITDNLYNYEYNSMIIKYVLIRGLNLIVDSQTNKRGGGYIESDYVFNGGYDDDGDEQDDDNIDIDLVRSIKLHNISKNKNRENCIGQKGGLIGDVTDSYYSAETDGFENDFNIDFGEGNHRLVNLCNKVEANKYLSGIGAKSYIEENIFCTFSTLFAFGWFYQKQGFLPSYLT